MDRELIGSRIKQRRDELNMTQGDIAEQIGVAISTVQRYEKGQISKIKLPVVEAIARTLDVDPDWLIGKSDIRNRTNRFYPPDAFPLPSSRSYPLIGDIACGEPILAEQNISEYINFPGDLNADFCLRCRGDSMIDARIHDGDVVFIRQQPDVEDGEIAAVLIGGEATLKRVYRSGGALTLMPANPAYAPMVYSGDQLSEIRILGKAVNFLSAVK